MSSSATKLLRVALMPCDGIGREVIPSACRIMSEVSTQGLIPKLEFHNLDAGFEHFQKTGHALPRETIRFLKANQADCALFGSVSSPSHKVEGYNSPIVQLRKELDLYANIRPVMSVDGTAGQKIDLVIVRENTECLYIKSETTETLANGDKIARAIRQITSRASERIGRMALKIAIQRGMLCGRSPYLTVVHKSNVLRETDGLFRESVRKVAAEPEFASVKLDEQLVDSMVYRLFREPHVFDIVVAPNLYGDIISDGAAALVGSLGVVPSLNAGDTFVMGEPVHGSAPDIAGQGIANPIASIRSVALMLHHLGYDHAAKRIYGAVDATIRQGDCLTPDLGGKGTTAQIEERILGLLRD